VRLDRNQRQSRIEKRILGRNVVHPQENAQQREEWRKDCTEEKENRLCKRKGSEFKRRISE